jgi:hypothetical protein
MFITGVLIVYHAREIPVTPAETPCFPVPFYALPPSFLPVNVTVTKKRACFSVKQALFLLSIGGHGRFQSLATFVIYAHFF